MKNKLYVGNLPFAMKDENLAELFAAAGSVASANVIIDRASGRSKGFGFVEMSSEAEANQAIEQLNGKEVSGRNIKVSVAKEKEARPRSNNNGGYSARW